MAIIFHPTDSAIVRGIKTVGVGKKGSQSLSSQLVEEILRDLKAGIVSDAAKGAFFAGLSLKGLTVEEMILDQYFDQPGTLGNPVSLARSLCKDAPELIQSICQKIMSGHTLDQSTAYTLGQFLFSNHPGDAARGLIASALRVRYETDDEYAGILQAMQTAIHPSFAYQSKKEPWLIQLAEPFDGNDKSYMITPILGQYLTRLNFRVLHMVGRNSGPKLEMNLLDVAQHLEARFLTQASDIDAPSPELGWFLRQKDLSQAIDHWVDLRRQTIKRPFLATLEKFLNPFKAQVIATSAFHPPYGEKMLTISERAGFPKVIVIRNGIEGSLAFSLKRETRILCSVQLPDGTYQRHEIIFDPEKFLNAPIAMEEKVEHPKAIDNARLIKEYMGAQKTNNPHFDLRVQATCEGFRQALAWMSSMDGVEG